MVRAGMVKEKLLYTYAWRGKAKARAKVQNGNFENIAGSEINDIHKV